MFEDPGSAKILALNAMNGVLTLVPKGKQPASNLLYVFPTVLYALKRSINTVIFPFSEDVAASAAADTLEVIGASPEAPQVPIFGKNTLPFCIVSCMYGY